MVKNLSTIDRGTKVRFGRWHNDDQAENTIVINASDTPINADHAGLFMQPVRRDEGVVITLMGLDATTGEIVDSNINAQAVQGREIDFYANLGNTITSTIVYEADNALVTTGNIGISNLEPIHTLDVGSKFSVDETGANVVTIRGDSYIQDNLVVGGNLAVRGTLTTIDTENTTIKDAIVEIGKGNTTSDVGFIMNRPGSNVTIGYRDSIDEFVIAHTDSSANSTTIVPSEELIDVRVHGSLHTNSNLSVATNLLYVDAISDRVGINTIFPQSTLDVIGDAKIASNLAVGTDGLYVDTVNSRVGINTTLPTTDFQVEGEALVSGNLNVTHDITVTENVYVSNNLTVTKDVTVEGEVFAKTDLTVTENVYVSNNLTVTKDVTVNGDVFAKTDLTVTENVYVSNNLTVTKDVTVNGDVFAKTDLTVTENAYVSNNLTVTKDVTVNGEIFAKTDLTVTENAFVSNNLTITKDLTTEGNIFVNTDLTVTENVYVSNNLTVTKDVTVNGEIFAKTDLTVTENVYVSNNLTITKDLTTEGEIFAKTDLTVTENAFISNNLTVTKSVIVSGDTSTTSKTTGALTIVGGVGVQGNVHATNVNFEDAEVDSLTVTDTTASTSVTTGAAKIAGGLGVVGNVYADTFYGDGSNLTGAFSMTSIVTTSDVNIGNNISIAALTENTIPYVGAGKYLADSHITQSNDTTIISSNLEIRGNVLIIGNSFAIESNSFVVKDRIIGIANNNSSHLLDVGIVMQHPGKNIGLIHHGAATENDPHDHTFTIGYTQNTLTDNHILDDSNLITVEILGNLVTQNNLTVSHDAIISGSTPSSSKTTGALQVAGGVGIIGDVFAESGDFTSLVTTSNVATTNLTASDTIHTTNLTTSNISTVNITSSDTVHTTNVATTNLTASDTIHTTNVATINVTASDTIHTTNVATTNLTASDTIHTTNVATTNLTASDTIHTANLIASDTVKVTNGLITNLGGLTKKTYGYSSGTITASTTPEINVVFANQMFSAKITAHLVEPTSNISVLNLDVTGGTGRDIGKGFLSITGDENSKHWNSTITTTDTTVTLTPSTGLISNGTYGIHVEHTSPLGVGGVTSIDKDNTAETTFNY